VRPLTFVELAACRAAYVEATGCSPPEEATPSAEQLAALQALLNSGRVPFCDFAVWGPYGARAARFRKTEASVFIAGELVSKRVDGPSSYDAWAASWDLFASDMISLRAARVGTLNRYKAGVLQLTRLFPRMWGILQTTDVIVRTERWSRLREQVESAKSMGGATGMDPTMPWDIIISMSSFGTDGPNSSWWQAHFVLPCTLASSPGGASGMIHSVEGYPTAGGNVRAAAGGQAEKPKTNPKAKQQSDKPGAPEVCSNRNRRVGRCQKDVPCPANRLHVCDVCGGPHRSCDEHGQGKGSKRFWSDKTRKEKKSRR